MWTIENEIIFHFNTKFNQLINYEFNVEYIMHTCKNIVMQNVNVESRYKHVVWFLY